MKKMKGIRNTDVNIFKVTKGSIEGLKSNPIVNLRYLIPVAICLTAIISGIVTYIMFIVNGGYSAQVNALKENGLLDGVDKGFTAGTTGMIVKGIGGYIIFGLAGVEIIIMIIWYFKISGKAKRIIMIVDLVVLAVLIALTVTAFRIVIINLMHGDRTAYQTIWLYNVLKVDPNIINITYAAMIVISLVTFIVLFLITVGCPAMLAHTILSLIFSTVFVPLLFLFLQNVIPLVTTFATIMVAFAAICVVVKVLSVIAKVKASIEINEKTGQKEKHFGGSTTFWRDKCDILSSLWDDCIYYKDYRTVKRRICTVSEFEKGEVAIIYNGKRVVNLAGCKTPEK